MSCIRLPYGGIDNENEKTIKLASLTNYKFEDLFSQLSCLANLSNPIFQSSVKTVNIDREDLQ